VVQSLAVFIHEKDTREQVIAPEAAERNVGDPSDRSRNKVVSVERKDSKSLLLWYSDYVELGIVRYLDIGNFQVFELLAILISSEVYDSAVVASLSVHIKLFAVCESEEYILVV